MSVDAPRNPRLAATRTVCDSIALDDRYVSFGRNLVSSPNVGQGESRGAGPAQSSRAYEGGRARSDYATRAYSRVSGDCQGDVGSSCLLACRVAKKLVISGNNRDLKRDDLGADL
jgi:hypothetical protein